MLLWDTSLPRDALVALAGVTLASAGVVGYAAHIGRREPARAHFLQLVYRVMSTAVFAVVPWLEPQASGRDPDKYLLFMLLLAVVAGKAVGITDSGEHGTAGTILIIAGALPYVAASLYTEEWLLAGIGLLWSVMMTLIAAGGARAHRQLKSLRAASDHAAHHDELTNLLNRSGFLAAMERLPATEAHALAVIDLNQFKRVNDVYGHSAGDHVLGVVARRLERRLPDDSIIGRLGGDEFAALVPVETDMMELAAQFETAVVEMAKPVVWERRLLQANVSVGLTPLSPEMSRAAALSQADLAMYRSKRERSATVTLFDQSMRDELNRRVKMEEHLRTALTDGSITFWAQPLVDANTRAPLRVELLARWLREDGTITAPDEFIPLAEQTGLVIDLGRLALKTAGQLLGQWAGDPILGELGVNVNISPRHLASGLTADALRAYNRGDRRLGIEFVENDLIDVNDMSRHVDHLGTLRDLGFRLIVDDFGTGYSSLSYLWSLPLDSVKIDRSFIDGIESDDRRRKVVSTISTLTSELGIPCVAEGVETEAGLATVAAAGVEVVQGYGIARPVPLDQLEAVLRRLADEASAGAGVPGQSAAAR